MHIVIIIESRTIVSLISSFHPKLVLMFFHTYSIRDLWNYVQSWNFVSIIIFLISVKEGGDNNCEKQLMIIGGEWEFDEDVLKYHGQ
jgi:hypothetical protein